MKLRPRLTKITRHTPLQELPALMITDEANAFLALPRTSFYRLLKSGRLESMRIGKRLWVSREHLDKFLKGTGVRHLPTYGPKKAATKKPSKPKARKAA